MLGVSAHAASSSLTGVVKDSLGHALSGAEVLVLADQLPIAPLASAQTNAEGRYSIEELDPGVYRVAALKQGYLAYLGRIDTLLKTSMDFVLRPAPASADGSAAVPDDAAWVLRVPERSILRDTEASDLLRGGAPSPSAAKFYETIQGEVRHVVALGGMPSAPDAGVTEVAGTDTSLRISSSVGERTQVRIQGRRESVEPDAVQDDRASGLDGSSMLVDVSYDTGNDSKLTGKAYYGTRDLSFAADAVLAGQASVREGQRTWGYDAAWAKQLDPGSRMTFQVGYLETSLAQAVVPEGGMETSQDLDSRVAGARGLFETVVGEAHHVSVGARAERATASDDVVPGVVTGWTGRLHAEDTWAATGPVSLVYGIALDHGLDAPGATAVVPHAGYTLSAQSLSVRMIVSYRLLGDGSVDRAWIDPFGYQVEVEAPLSHGMYFQGSIQRTPEAEPGLDAPALAAWTSGSLLPVLDGGPGSQRARISLERQGASTRMKLSWTSGTAEGLSTQLLPLAAPFRIETEPTLRYAAGGIGVRLLPTGTDLAAEYVRVQDGSMRIGDSVVAPLEEYIELRVAQDLVRLPGWGGTCRLLVAARTSPRQEEDDASSDSARTLAVLNHRLSAGLSVAF
jgi:hypothetical protein